MKTINNMDTEKPFICIDEDGYYNTLTGRLWNCHIDDPRRIRQARFNKFVDKYGGIVGIVGSIAIAALIIGYFAFCVTHIQSEPQPIMTQQGLAVQKQFSALSEDDQAQIVQDYQQEQQPPDSDADPYASQYDY